MISEREAFSGRVVMTGRGLFRSTGDEGKACVRTGGVWAQAVRRMPLARSADIARGGGREEFLPLRSPLDQGLLKEGGGRSELGDPPDHKLFVFRVRPFNHLALTIRFSPAESIAFGERFCIVLEWSLGEKCPI